MKGDDTFELWLAVNPSRFVMADAEWQGRRVRARTESTLEELRRRLQPGPVRRDARRVDPGTQKTLTLRQIGDELFAWLPQEVRHGWAMARFDRTGSGRRLCLQLWLDEALLDLPWEALCEPKNGPFIAASLETSLARYVSPTRPDAPPRAGGKKLRVQVFVAVPSDQERLAAEEEIRLIRESLAGRDIEVERVPRGDIASLVHCLKASPPDILHWIGHGRIDAAHGGELLVESPDGTSKPMRPDQLAELLRGGPSLVVLAACDSARSGTGEAMAAVAPVLACAGVPAVVAMQNTIRDDDAVRFTQALYTSLLEADDIAAAVAMARRHLLIDASDDAGAWAVPVLYRRDADLEVTGSRPEARSTRAAPRGRAMIVAALLIVLALGIWWVFEAPPGVVGNADPRCPVVPDLVPGLDLPLVYLEAGSFVMGSASGETDERPAHLVTLREPFCLGRFEVTVGQWNAVMPDDVREADDNLPATHISWDDATRFVVELNRRVPKRPFRLPTEAEWEYAARAGTGSTWSFGNDEAHLPRFGNCSPRDGNDGFDRTAPVGSLAPNPWGLFDMHGNVTEWVADTYGPYPSDAATDPRGAREGGLKVRRGGNYLTVPENCSSSRRFASPPDGRIHTTGLRLASDAGV